MEVQVGINYLCIGKIRQFERRVTLFPQSLNVTSPFPRVSMVHLQWDPADTCASWEHESTENEGALHRDLAKMAIHFTDFGTFSSQPLVYIGVAVLTNPQMFIHILERGGVQMIHKILVHTSFYDALTIDTRMVCNLRDRGHLFPQLFNMTPLS